MKPIAILLAGLVTACAAPKVDPPPVSPPAADQCGAAGLQGYVGKLRSDLPSLDPGKTRVACTTCPVTKDFRPDRLNVFYEEATGRIASITCG